LISNKSTVSLNRVDTGKCESQHINDNRLISVALENATLIFSRKPYAKIDRDDENFYLVRINERPIFCGSHYDFLYEALPIRGAGQK
jgi:hypothetical protein